MNTKQKAALIKIAKALKEQKQKKEKLQYHLESNDLQWTQDDNSPRGQ